MREYRYKGKWADVQVHLTNWCDHRCAHCYTASSLRHKSWLPINVFAGVVEFTCLDSSRIIRLLGGEVVTDALELIPYLAATEKTSNDLVICTNGYCNTAWEQGSLAPEMFHEIIVSCYGVGHSHDIVTGVVGSSERTWRLIEYLTRRPSRGYEVTVNTLITQENGSKLLDFLRRLTDVGIDEVKILVLSPLGTALDQNRRATKLFWLRPSERATIRGTIRQAVREGLLGNMRVVMESTYADVDTENGHHIPGCRLHKESMLTVDQHGNVYPCHLMIYQPKFAIGSLLKEDLETLRRRYVDDGGGRVFEKRAVAEYGPCPAYCGRSIQNQLNMVTKPLVCPLHLELVDG